MTTRFPVLHYGSVPRYPTLENWDLRIFGAVDETVRLTWDQLLALPHTELTTDIHCVTRWSKLDTKWEGIPFQEIMKLVKVDPKARFVIAHAEYGFTANTPLEFLDRPDALLAFNYDGKPLEQDHGYPLRLLVPGKYFWKSAKWLRGIEFSLEDKLGFWERNGYNNSADPWKEERYSNDAW